MFDDAESLEEFARMIAEANNLPLETAREYAGRIGDTPMIADDGSDRVVVFGDDGQEIARVTLPYEGD